MWIADDLLYIPGFGGWVILLYQTMAGQIKKKNLLLLGEKYIVEKNCVLQHNDKNKYIFRRIVRLHFFIAKKKKKIKCFHI